MQCKDVQELVHETYIETEKECRDTIEELRIFPDKMVTKLQ